MAIARKGAPIEVLETSRSHDNKLSACKNLIHVIQGKNSLGEAVLRPQPFSIPDLTYKNKKKSWYVNRGNKLTTIKLTAINQIQHYK